MRDAVEGILRHSWREAVERESAMLMWVAELPEHVHTHRGMAEDVGGLL